jgi:hypothetical protein
MINWENSKPNARYWVLKLLKDNFGPGDKLVLTKSNTSQVLSQAFITNKGKKLLLINKRDNEIQLELPIGTKDAQMFSVDGISYENPPMQNQISGTLVTLQPFAVAVIDLKE